ncbi:ATP-dependent helicase [Candidatus Finniella inopinata]|uniref:DNA 3'-5' helicase n=1 Tax=Candidatus Finniella inopinata TaxID=1696036 RepID=A0A4Q7DHF4_9PROT|nr:UvrD-helicase domain-containing protein [Candidatus Finniella inopinata]RZI46142.1 DNA helicase II [Candidatus Finniella inopinata]
MASPAEQLMQDTPHQPSYLDNLNPNQHQAVLKTQGPLLILAGAGTGKTRVLTTRLAHILLTNLAYPAQVLAVTFTNRAAQEMRERIAHILQRPVEGMWLGTFHSLSARILRRHAELVGLQPNFTILDTDDQLRLIKQLLKANNIDEKQTPARMVLSLINRWKDRGLLPAQVKRSGNDLISGLYQDYQERLLVLNAVDFGDLLLHCLTFFRQEPVVLKSYQEQFQYMLVDEYQDTNVAQYLWLRLLAQGAGNLCCVGDDDQSIYGWRGAEVGNILRFEQDFPGAEIVRLEQNYRSTPHILAAASGLIAHNRERLGKTLWTEDTQGEQLLVRGTWDSVDEARFIGDQIENRQRQGDRLSSIAILVRASFQTREFEECLLRLGIPYRVIGGPRFYERLEIRDALAYLRLVVQGDDGLAFERIINTPRRGIGQTTLQTMHILARDQGISLPRAAHYYAHNIAKGAAGNNLRLFFENLDRWRALLETDPHVEVVKMILDESGYTAMWQEDKSADAPGRLENLKELVTAIGQFQYLPGFLEHVSLVMENNQQSEQDMVNLMTLHAAKGLEFDTVFLAGWEENLFPHPRALNENGEAGLEEERRLGYVGISRARQRAIISYALQRRMYQGGWQLAIPSRFIKELPDAHMTHIHANGQSSRRPPVQLHHNAPKTLHSFDIGDRVFHQKFGYGEILDFDGEKVDIDFEHSGHKKIIADFISRA